MDMSEIIYNKKEEDIFYMSTLSNDKNNDFDDKDLRYLRLLANQYSNIDSACNEIINLKAILGLPKGTEHFLSDIHGEYKQFIHILKNASGVIKRKIDDIFGDSLTAREKKSLATLIYYPEQKFDLLWKEQEDKEQWCKKTLHRLIKMCRLVSSKYTRLQVRGALPKDFAYIIEEMLHERHNDENKQEYYNEIIQTIIDLQKVKDFVINLCQLIQRLSIYRLHIIGDIYDRGPGADIIMDRLVDYHSVDIQWGNHDILWMGAGAGSDACIANCLRVSLRYANMKFIEDGYGINVLPLATFAMDTYFEDDCKQFKPKLDVNKEEFAENELNLIKRMHKAISIIQFKLEGQIIKRRPQYKMEDRLLLDKIDFDSGTITCPNGNTYKLNDTNFPTIDLDNPYELSFSEKEVVDKLRSSFRNSEKLQKHIKFLFSNGGLYLVYNSNLLFHGCIPLLANGDFSSFFVDNNEYKGKVFMDRVERLAREGYFSTNPKKKLYGTDAMWYLWSGDHSPLFGKTKMATFERYFIDDKETHQEDKNPYYKFRDDEKVCRNILKEFGLDPETSRIINGHVPVKVKKGESPVKANGKLLVIDGGFSKAYQSQTGIAGYTLIYNSHGMILAAHEPFKSFQKAIEEERDILPDTITLKKEAMRKRVRDTDRGKELKQKVEELTMLVQAYRKGIIK
jgi:fructose-1,6-bisphosphatase III